MKKGLFSGSDDVSVWYNIEMWCNFTTSIGDMMFKLLPTLRVCRIVAWGCLPCFVLNGRGQYIRSVDFEGNAHKWGLCAGDRILAVNDVPCCDETHEVVKAMIQQRWATLALQTRFSMSSAAIWCNFSFIKWIMIGTTSEAFTVQFQSGTGDSSCGQRRKHGTSCEKNHRIFAGSST